MTIGRPDVPKLAHRSTPSAVIWLVTGGPMGLYCGVTCRVACWACPLAAGLWLIGLMGQGTGRAVVEAPGGRPGPGWAG